MVKISLLADAFGPELGEIIVDKDTVHARYKGSKITVPLSYLREIHMLGKTQLGKVKARIVLYDILGTKNDIEAIISEPNFFMLRGLIKNK